MKDQNTSRSGPRSIPVDAGGWCARMHSPDVNETDREQFQVWLEMSPENRAEYSMCELSWRVSHSLADSPQLMARLPARPSGASVSGRRRMPFMYAAAAALLMGVAIFLTDWQQQTSLHHYQTVTGEQHKAVLPDGSVVDLNTNTDIEVALGGDTREIALHRGEAYFDVTSDPGRPFIVKTVNSEIRVLGTAFNVRYLEDKTVITVAEGRVQLVPVSKEGTQLYESAVEILPGNQVSVSAAYEMSEIRQVGLGGITSWRNGNLVFKGDHLAVVVQELNRYFKTPLAIEDSITGTIPISGVFKTADLNSVLKLLKQGHGVKAEEREGQLTLYREK